MRASRDSITDLGDGRYRIRITVGYDPATGKQARASKTIRGSRRKAEIEAERMHRIHGSATVFQYSRMYLLDFIEDEWLPTRKVRPTTLRGYQATIDNHIAPAFEQVRLGDITPLHITRALAEIESEGAALNVYKMLRAVFNHALEMDAIDRSPLRKSMQPVVPRYEAEVYTLEEMLEVIELFEGDPVEAGVIIAATCGLRRSEVCALDWSRLTLEQLEGEDGRTEYRGQLVVAEGFHQLDGQRFMTAPKTDRSSRVVAIPGFAVERLLELRGASDRIGPLMLGADGERMSPDGFTYRWRKMMVPRFDEKGAPTYTPPVRYIPLKNLRHSQSTVLIALGVPIAAVSVRDGHGSVTTTDTFYNRPGKIADHGTAAVMDQAAEKLRGRG